MPLLLVASLAWPAPGPARAGDPNRAAAVKARGDLHVCIWPEYFSISYRNPRSGDLAGIDIDLARDFARRLGVRALFVETTPRDFMDRLEDDACDIAMFGVGITPQRAARVDFAEPYLVSPVYGVTTRDNRIVRGWDDIDQPGNAVAVAAGTYMEPLMRAALRHAELVSVAPPQTREAELQSGRVDVFMSDFPYTRRMLLLHEWVRIIEPPDGFGATRYAHAVPKDEPAWLAEVNAFEAAARQDGTLLRAAERNGLAPIVLR